MSVLLRLRRTVAHGLKSSRLSINNKSHPKYGWLLLAQKERLELSRRLPDLRPEQGRLVTNLSTSACDLDLPVKFYTFVQELLYHNWVQMSSIFYLINSKFFLTKDATL